MRNMQTCEMSGHKTLQSFDFLESFFKYENQQQVTTEQLKCKYFLIWMRNMQKCEMLKMIIFFCAGPRS